MGLSLQRRAPGALITCALLLGGCEQGRNEYVEPPPPKVTVSKPLEHSYVDQLEFTGTLAAVETVDLEARVTGFLEKIGFADGDIVEQNQLLFVIDPKPFQAAVDRAKAQVTINQAEIARARTEYERNRRLAKSGAARESDVVRWKAQLDSAKGALEAAKAEVVEAELKLGYTQVRAPFAGRMNRRQVDVGNLVGADEKTLLATVTRDDPVYVYFSMSEPDALRVRARAREGADESTDSRLPLYKRAELPVDVGLANEDGYPHTGKIDYIDPQLDPETGTLTARGVIENPQRTLVPGMFVRVRFAFGAARDALMVPEGVLGVDQSGRYALVVGKDGTVEKRPVTVGQRVSELVVIETGLEAGDRVVINGLQRARPGIAVTPEESQIDPAAARDGASGKNPAASG